jgi:hypothetical protein
MAWITNDQTYTDVVAEIERQRDRGAALVAAALLEEHLLLAIRSALTRHESVEQKMFQGRTLSKFFG